MNRTAEISKCGYYRYTLMRQWGDGPCLAWMMFNPSTADANLDDPTIRKCIGFSQRWGYGRLAVLNLFAIRGADPKIVQRVEDPIGPLTAHWFEQTLAQSSELICAWGCAQHFSGIDFRIAQVLSTIRSYEDVTVNCLGYRKDRHPRHPLMLSYETPRQPFREKL